jgi:hypothetical protein
VQDGAGKLEVYSTDAVNYYLFGLTMGIIYRNWYGITAAVRTNPAAFKATPYDVLWFDDDTCSQARWNWPSTKALVALWRTFVTLNPQMNDGSEIEPAIAFAEAGFYNNWNYINGIGIADAKVCTTAYTGSLEWVLGAPTSSEQNAGAKAMIVFTQSGSNYGTWKNLLK